MGNAKIMSSLHDSEGNFVGFFDEIIREENCLRCRIQEEWYLYTKDGKKVLVESAKEIQYHRDHVVVCRDKTWQVQALTQALA